MEARTRDARKAGLHPLAALGIAPAGSSPIPGIAPAQPGPSPTGSAIESGIRTMQSAQRFQQTSAHQQSIGGADAGADWSEGRSCTR